jgi:hypothetical protein
MLRIEDKLEQTQAAPQTLREQVDQMLADIPLTLSLGENLNVQPVKLPLFVGAQLGFMAVYPFRLLPMQLPQQNTGAGTTFLRWRKPDRSAMWVTLWQEPIASPATPAHLVDDL